MCRFWDKDSWKGSLEAAEASPGIPGKYAMARGINVCHKYLETQNGILVSGHRVHNDLGLDSGLVEAQHAVLANSDPGSSLPSTGASPCTSTTNMGNILVPSTPVASAASEPEALASDLNDALQCDSESSVTNGQAADAVGAVDGVSEIDVGSTTAEPHAWGASGSDGNASEDGEVEVAKTLATLSIPRRRSAM